MWVYSVKNMDRRAHRKKNAVAPEKAGLVWVKELICRYKEIAAIVWDWVGQEKVTRGFEDY